ncbi:MAG TPA: DEAD/DEAH box helicase [Ruminiclostridium sp.]
MKSSFNDMGISSPILKALDEMGFETPTEVQSTAIPHILNKEDLIVMSKTGSGKTAVFGVSMLQMTDSGAEGPQGLILIPTRELAVQVDSDLKQMSKYLQHKTTAVYGQHNMNFEIQALNKGVSIVAGTPGRVYDHIRHGNLKTKHIRFLVLDEADRMLDMGFLDQVEQIIKTLPRDRVTLLFSATIPTEIRKICREYMRHPVTIEIESQTKTVDTTQQVYCRVDNNEKKIQLNRLLLVERPESCMIFCNTRIAVDRVQIFLSRKGYVSQALHGDIPQGKRLKTIQEFKQGDFHLLVATDVAARGIHVDDLSLVINYDVPMEKDSYVHRIGRTGRAGNVGRAITMVTSEDIMSLYEIEEHIGAMIAEVELPTEADFNEHRDLAEKWIQLNSPKIKSPVAASELNLKEPQKKYPHAKPPQHHENYRERPIQANTDHKTAKKISTAHPFEQTKPVHAIVRPTPPHSMEADVVSAKGSVEMVHSQHSTARKPFLQRVIQRILGK